MKQAPSAMEIGSALQNGEVKKSSPKVSPMVTQPRDKYVDIVSFRQAYNGAVSDGYKGKKSDFAIGLEQEGFTVEGFSDYKKTMTQNQMIKDKRTGYFQMVGDVIDKRYLNVKEQAQRNKELKDQAKEGGIESREQYEDLKLSNINRVLTPLGEISGGLFEVVFNTAGRAVDAVTPEKLDKFVQRGQRKVWNAVKDKQFVQDAIQTIANGAKAWEKREKQNPEQAEFMGNMINIADAVTLGVGTKVAKEVGEKVAKEVAEKSIEQGKKLLNYSTSKSKEVMSKFENTPTSKDDLVGMITQETDATKFKQLGEALEEFDFSDIDDIQYDELLGSVKERVGILSDSKKGFLQQNNKLFKAGETEIGYFGGLIKKDYIKQGLDLLEGIFDEKGEVKKLAMIKQLKDRFQKGGIGLDDMDEIAKLFPSNIKSFANNGTPLSSKFAVSGENVRKGIKDFVRKNAGNYGNVVKDADRRISNLKTLEKTLEGVTKKVQNVRNKFMNRSLGDKVGDYIMQTVDMVSGGLLRGGLRRLFPSNVGLKQANYNDLQKHLAKRLKLLQAIEDVPEDISKGEFGDFIKYMKKETGLNESELDL